MYRYFLFALKYQRVQYRLKDLDIYNIINKIQQPIKISTCTYPP